MLFGKTVNEKDTYIDLTDDHILIFSSIENLAKFGYKPYNEEHKENLERLFTEGKKARFFVHWSSACSEDNTIKLAHIQPIK